MLGHWGLQKCKEYLYDPIITERTITQFIRQCPSSKVQRRLKDLIKTHPLTCASYNPFEVLQLDHIGQGKLQYPGMDRYILSMVRIISHLAEQCARGIDGGPLRERGSVVCIDRQCPYVCRIRLE